MYVDAVILDESLRYWRHSSSILELQKLEFLLFLFYFIIFFFLFFFKSRQISTAAAAAAVAASNTILHGSCARIKVASVLWLGDWIYTEELNISRQCYHLGEGRREREMGYGRIELFTVQLFPEEPETSDVDTDRPETITRFPSLSLSLALTFGHAEEKHKHTLIFSLNIVD